MNDVEGFNEHTLRADIVSVWGEYGAHVDVFDFMVAEIVNLRARVGQLEKALTRVDNWMTIVDPIHPYPQSLKQQVRAALALKESK
jgi:hypothetical protein